MTQQTTKAKAQKTAISPTRQENFPEWYQAVIKAADMAENAPVRGCMIIKPYGFAIWENIQKHFDSLIKNEDVQNAYFPLLIPLSYIAKEAEHVDGFAKECAVVTHHRLEQNAEGQLVPASPLTEPMIIRPTSETIIGESMKNWVQSYRDLPLKLNQWCNVMRWEMRPRIFLRTTEFLWHEGHCAFATAEEADQDARHMLHVYADFFKNYLAIPGLPGIKTPDERFPGAIETYTIEAIMQDGKALQACTSHNLGQTFAKSSDIKYLDADGALKHAWTTSWGMSTRTIGGLIMTHADDDGLIIPPRIAPYPVVILPFINNPDDTAAIMKACDELKQSLSLLGLRAQIDKSDARHSDKMWQAIKKGVPLRVEIGARELTEGSIVFTRRDRGKEGKVKVAQAQAPAIIASELESMQQDLYEAAMQRMKSLIFTANSLDEAREFFTSGRAGVLKIDISLLQDQESWQALKAEFALSTRCLPFEDDGQTVIIGKSY